MTRAELIPESLIGRMHAQLAHLGVDVRLHAANVREMCERLPGLVKNPQGLFVTWCQREADAHQARAAANERDRDRYAELQVQLFAFVALEGASPRFIARVLTQALHEGYTALNRRTIDKLRAMGDRWERPAVARDTEGPREPGARDAAGVQLQGAGPGRSDAGAQTD